MPYRRPPDSARGLEHAVVPPAGKPVARRTPRAACEALEGRRLFAVELISVAAGGAAAGNSGSPMFEHSIAPEGPASVVSDDGRFVVFTSNATDLVAGVTPSGTGDVYVRDRGTGVTSLVSVRPDGQPAGNARSPTISGDGRFVAFEQFGTGVTATDTGGYSDVFVRDLQTGTTAMASRGPSGTTGMAGDSYSPAISRDGRYVVFASEAVDTSAPRLEFVNIYRYDVQSGAVQSVTDVYAAAGLGGSVGQIRVSDDCDVIAFHAVYFDGQRRVYVRNMQTGTNVLASTTTAGAPASVEAFTMSGDGNKVAFSTETAAAPNDDNTASDVYVRDLAAGTTTLASVTNDGTAADGFDAGGSYVGGISRDGRYVVISSGDDLTGVPDKGGIENTYIDVFLRDLAANTTRMLSVDVVADPEEAEESYLGAISPDGRYASFFTDRPFMGPNPTQLVVVDLATGTEKVINQKPGCVVYELAEGVNEGPVFSRSGNLVVFAGASDASALLPSFTDTNGRLDIFAQSLAGGAVDLQPPTTVLASLAPLTATAAAYDFNVTYVDDVLMDPATAGTGDLVVSGPNGFRQVATLVSAAPIPGATQVNATYRVTGPNGVFDAAANGAYAIEVVAGEVKDAAGHPLAAGPVAGAAFSVNIAAPDAPDLQAGPLQGAIPASAVAGATQKVKPLRFTVTNSGTQPADGVVIVRLVASADGVADAGDAIVTELPNQKVKLAPGRSKVFRIKPRTFPAVADGDYRLLAVVDAGGAMAERLESNNAAPAAATVRIAAPFSDVGVSAPSLSGGLAPGKKATLLVSARNEGNVAAKGVQSARVRLTADPANPAAVSRVLDVPIKLNLKPGATKVLRAKLALPADLPAGTYYLVIELLPGAPWDDPDAADNTATAATAYTV